MRTNYRGSLLFALALMPAVTCAQVFKCMVGGKQVYQQHACEQTGASGAKLGNLNEGGPADGAARSFTRIPSSVPESGKDLCIEGAPLAAIWKDRESVRVESIVRMGSSTIEVRGKRVLVHTYAVSINAKNSYGGYTGARSHYCNVSADETVFLSYDL